MLGFIGLHKIEQDFVFQFVGLFK